MLLPVKILETQLGARFTIKKICGADFENVYKLRVLMQKFSLNWV